MTKHDFDITNELLQRMLELEHRLTRHEMTTAQTQMGRSDLSHKVRKLEDGFMAQSQIVRDQGRLIDHLEKVVGGLKQATDDLTCQKKTVEFIDDDDNCVNNDMLLTRFPIYNRDNAWTDWHPSSSVDEISQSYIDLLKKTGGILGLFDSLSVKPYIQYRYGQP